jgi:predicted metal-dependent hydrolase
MKESALHTIPYGSKELCFSLQRKDRSTLAIHVHPDMSVEIVAPLNADLEKIYAKVRKRARWITRQVYFFRQFHPKKSERKFEPGETHRYLGRQYRLKLIPSIQSDVSLSGGFIVVKTHYPKRAKHTQELLEAWFVLRAKERFKARLQVALERFPDPDLVTPKGMIVRSLESRWGSMTAAGNLVLNWRLIHASTQCIDYVITHELCHLIHANHGREFWNLLARVFPEWEKYKNKLESDLC